MHRQDHTISQRAWIVAPKPIKPTATARATATPTATATGHLPTYTTAMHSKLVQQDRNFCLRQGKKEPIYPKKTNKNLSKP